MDGFVIRGSYLREYDRPAPAREFYVSRLEGTKNPNSWRTFDPTEARIFASPEDAQRWLDRTENPWMIEHDELTILPADVTRRPEPTTTPCPLQDDSPWVPCGGVGVLRVDHGGRRITD